MTFHADKNQNHRQSQGSGKRRRNEVKEALSGLRNESSRETQTPVGRWASGCSFHSTGDQSMNRREGARIVNDNGSEDVVMDFDKGKDVTGHSDEGRELTDHLDKSKNVICCLDRSKNVIGHSDKSKGAVGYSNEGRDVICQIADTNEVIGLIADTSDERSSGRNEDKDSGRDNSRGVLDDGNVSQDLVSHEMVKLKDSNFRSLSHDSVNREAVKENFTGEHQQNVSQGLTGCESVKDGAFDCDVLMTGGDIDLPTSSSLAEDCGMTLSPIKPVKVGTFKAFVVSDVSDDASCVSDTTADLLTATVPLCDISDLASSDDEGQGESSGQGVTADVSGNVEDSLNQGNVSPLTAHQKSTEDGQAHVTGHAFEAKVISGMEHFSRFVECLTILFAKHLLEFFYFFFLNFLHLDIFVNYV